MPKEKPTQPKHTVDTSPRKSLLSRMFTPLTDAPSRMAGDITSAMDTAPTENPLLARLKGFGMGAIEGAGDVVSGMTSPVSLATMAIPAMGALSRAGQAGNAARTAAMPRINARPDPITTIDLGPSDFRNVDDVMEYFAGRAGARRGTPADVPNNPVAQNLERERRAIERGMPPPRTPTEGDKKISNLQAQFRRSQMKRVK